MLEVNSKNPPDGSNAKVTTHQSQALLGQGDGAKIGIRDVRKTICSLFRHKLFIHEFGDINIFQMC
jgi:hypothetical protein